MPSLSHILHPQKAACRNAADMTDLFQKSSPLPRAAKILLRKKQESLVFSCGHLSEVVVLGISWRSLLLPNLNSVLYNTSKQSVEEPLRQLERD